MPLRDENIDHRRADELKSISLILDNNPIITEMVLQDLTQGVKNPTTGAEGMSAEQVLRAAVIKQWEGCSYQGLAFHIIDSRSYRNFCRIGIAHKGFKKSALCKNIKTISPETWEAINATLVAYRKDKNVEKGRESRMDCTVVSSNIHEPSDSSLLWDSVRVLTRMLNQAKEQFEGLKLQFTDHTRRAKRRYLGVMNAKNNKERNTRYKDLLKVSYKTIGYANTAAAMLDRDFAADPLASGLSESIKETIGLACRVIEQTEHRILY